MTAKEKAEFLRDEAAELEASHRLKGAFWDASAVAKTVDYLRRRAVEIENEE